MATSDTSLPPHAPRPRPPRPAPGPPVEVWFWRILRKQGRGEHRTLADNVQYDGWENIWVRRPPAPGRYRMEYRDARRTIISVRYVNVPDPRSGDTPYFTEGRARRPQRTVPPASPAWQPKAPPQATTPSRSTSTRSDQAGRATTTSSTATHPPLRPPDVAPTGMLWRLRKNNTWDHFDQQQAIPERYHRLWLPDQVILVYAPNGTWPGYVSGRLKSGLSCLVPREERS